LSPIMGITSLTAAKVTRDTEGDAPHLTLRGSTSNAIHKTTRMRFPDSKPQFLGTGP
jgi:hypothetical protein